MKARTVLAVLVLIAGRAESGQIDKPKLRQLAELPEISVSVGFGFSLLGGFSFNDEKLDPRLEIANLQKQFKGDASDAERYHRLGGLYRKVGRKKESDEAYAKAAALCRRQVREHPDDTCWLAQLGEALIYTGDIRESEKLLRRAVEGAPDEWRAWLALAECVDDRAVRAVFGDKAFSFHLLGEKIIPALFERKPTAEQIAEMRRLRDEARRYYDRAVALAPREMKPYYRRIASNGIHGVIDGTLRAARGEKVNMAAAFFAPACAADLSRIARLLPDDPRAIGTAVFLEVMTCVLHNKIDAGKETVSHTDLQKAKGCPVVDFLPAENREFARWGLDRLEQLTKSSDKGTAAGASEILAGLLWVLNMRDANRGVPIPASVPWDENITPKVVEHLRRAVQLDPSRERAWDLLTMLLAEKEKKIDEAIALARRRVAIKDNAHNRFLLAKTYAGQDQFDKAAEQLRAGLQRDPNDLDCRLGLAAVLLKRGDADALGQVREQLNAAGPRMKEPKSKSRGTLFLLLNGIYAALDDRPEAARELFHEVLRQDKGNTTAVKALAALGAPASPADEQTAIDYFRAHEGRIIRKGKQPDSPVAAVRLIDNKFTDDDLFFLSALPQLRYLYVPRSRMRGWFTSRDSPPFEDWNWNTPKSPIRDWPI